MLLRYFATLSAARFVLWCYFIWWTVVVVRYFDPTPRIWMTSVGISIIVGVALSLNATSGSAAGKLQLWPAIRFFMAPFCVSSFASLVKDRGFFLIFSPDWRELATAAGICVVLGLLALAARKHQASSIKH